MAPTSAGSEVPLTPDAAPRPRHQGTRTKARKRALDILFEADLLGGDPLTALADHVERDAPPVRPFTRDLVEGVTAERSQIDRIIADSLSGQWTIDRMPRVDRNLARIAIYEMWFTELAPEIAVGQAVDLGAQLSTDESPDFLNGLLGRALTTLRQTYPKAARGTSDDATDVEDDDEGEDDSADD